jgi:hypothetical protein
MQNARYRYRGRIKPIVDGISTMKHNAKVGSQMWAFRMCERQNQYLLASDKQRINEFCRDGFRGFFSEIQPDFS